MTLADSQGQFVLPSLPPGSYTLRAIGSGHEPSAARHVTVLPNRDALYTLSLTPVGEKPLSAPLAEDEKASSQAEWRWLVRHKRRSVLETAGPDLPATDDAPALALDTSAPLALGAFDGSVELAATGASHGGALDGDGPGLPAGMGSLQLQGRLTEGVSWTLGGLMSESEGRAWRVAAEFVLEPGAGHQIEVGAGYGAGASGETSDIGLVEPARALGAVFVRDRWQIGERLRATAGARYTYLGFLPDVESRRRRGGGGAAGRPRDGRARVVRDAHAHAGRRPADAVDRGGLARDHVGSARRRPAAGALAALRAGCLALARSVRTRERAALLRVDAGRAADGVRGRRAVRAQRRHARSEGVRSDRRPALRLRDRRLRHLHLRAGPPLGSGPVRRGHRSRRSRRPSSTTSRRASRPSSAGRTRAWRPSAG